MKNKIIHSLSMTASLLSISFVLTLATHGASAQTPAPPSEPPPSPYEKACADLAKKRFPSAEEKLKAIFDFEWNHDMETFPEWATYQGDPRGQDRFTDMSLNAIRLRERESKCPLLLIQSIDRKAIKQHQDRLNYDLFRRNAQESLEGTRFPGEFLVVDQMGGVHQSLPQLLLTMKKSSAADYAKILARLDKAPELIRQHIALLEEGLRLGITPPRATLRPVPLQVAPLLATDLDKNPLFEAFKNMPDSIPKEEQEKIRAAAKEKLLNGVIPELKNYRRFLEKTYVPQARESIAFTALPDGQAWYARLVKNHTTTPMTPQEIHELGLRETERIRAEMLKVMKEAGWKKDLPSFFQHLRTDPKFFFKKREDLLAAYRDITKRADPELPRFFGKLPRMTYGVKPVPEYAEKESPTGLYEGGSRKAGRPGWFVANTYDLKSRPKWEMEALALHETVPGHHLQIALAQEMDEMPEFRKEGFYTAYVEGWGLYAESLGSEMGFYKDPYSKMGQLTYEMWRANRLVVDTGLHAYGWTREQAIDFMKANMPKPLHDIRVEVDRYIVMPGQALAYKIGQLKFLELREKARKELGDRFDIRRFHDEILSDGALPLEVLETKMNEWIRANAQSEI